LVSEADAADGLQPLSWLGRVLAPRSCPRPVVSRPVLSWLSLTSRRSVDGMAIPVTAIDTTERGWPGGRTMARLLDR